MEQIIKQIVSMIAGGQTVDDRVLVKLINAQARASGQDKRRFAKRALLPFYQRVKREEPARWESWGVTPDIERALVACLRMKPRRTASGVATITVITKPWPCGSDCLYCPNDIRMPKSYLADEPACERAEQNFFDPYLQVSSRLSALDQMGHPTDKIELIVLGGTWSDYPRAYQIWFVHELFRALNDDARVGGSANPKLAAWDDGDGVGERGVPLQVARRRAFYREHGFPQSAEAAREMADTVQRRILSGELTYNGAHRERYGADAGWQEAAALQSASMEELMLQQRVNETSAHRVVGLVVETRPDAVTPESLALIRRLGATKVQMGIQSLNQDVLAQNNRGITVERIQRAFELLRVFGFKIHAHAMVNLLGATPQDDIEDYARLVGEAPFQPDEVKLYPCALIGGSHLCRRFADGSWVPYTDEQLMDVLVADVAATPAFCRISRMIRDFSSNDIIAGNKKPNLRQLVEARLGQGDAVREIRYREVGTRTVDPATLRLDVVPYQTSNTRERFLQWVTPEGHIAGFLRLSLPGAAYVAALGPDAPVGLGEAMIREVHVYGAVSRLGQAGGAAQHLGLGRALVERARSMAREEGYTRLNVISAVGTREYYRSLGFSDNGLYQTLEL